MRNILLILFLPFLLSSCFGKQLIIKDKPINKVPFTYPNRDIHSTDKHENMNHVVKDIDSVSLSEDNNYWFAYQDSIIETLSEENNYLRKEVDKCNKKGKDISITDTKKGIQYIFKKCKFKHSDMSIINVQADSIRKLNDLINVYKNNKNKKTLENSKNKEKTHSKLNAKPENNLKKKTNNVIFYLLLMFVFCIFVFVGMFIYSWKKRIL